MRTWIPWLLLTLVCPAMFVWHTIDAVQHRDWLFLAIAIPLGLAWGAWDWWRESREPQPD
jgi:hypothetical protein